MTQLSLIEGGEPPTEERFSYAALAPKVEDEVRDLTARIRANVRMSAALAAEIGRDLLRVQSLVGHGHFGLWVEEEFPLSHRTANKWMRIAKSYGAKLEVTSNLSAEVVDRLLCETTDEEVRTEVERRISAGELVTLATVEKLQAEAKAEKERLEAETKAEKDRADRAQQELESLAQRHAEIMREELQAKPAEQHEMEVAEEPLAAKSADVVNLSDHREAAQPQTQVEDAPEDEEEDENVPTDFSIQNVTHRAEAFSGAVSTLDFVEVQPEAFWKIFERESPAMRKRYFDKVKNAREKLNSILKEYPYA